MKTLLLTMALACLAAGCSTTQVYVAAGNHLTNFSRSITVDVSGEGVDPTIISELDRYLKAGLIIDGFDLDGADSKSIHLQVNVQRFEPGNGGLRFLIGFGAGRGSLIYTAVYTTPDGAVLAKMGGQERFTGGELDFNAHYGQFTTMGGADTVRKVLVQEAAKHIVALSRSK